MSAARTVPGALEKSLASWMKNTSALTPATAARNRACDCGEASQLPAARAENDNGAYVRIVLGQEQRELSSERVPADRDAAWIDVGSRAKEREILLTSACIEAHRWGFYTEKMLPGSRSSELT